MRGLHDELVQAFIDYLDAYNQALGKKLREHRAANLRKQLRYLADVALMRRLEVQLQRSDRSKAGIKQTSIDENIKKIHEFQEQKQRKELGKGGS